jgi:uncharacterized protein (TIGR03435 family)
LELTIVRGDNNSNMIRNRFFACVFLCLLPAAWAQSPGAPARPEFEVASVKPNTGGSMAVGIMMQPGGRFSATNVPLKFLIGFAYDVKDFQISGGPAWINSDRYDISAKAEDRVPPGQIRQMTQALLADRFKLTLHRESKELAVYELVAAKGGLKIAPSKEGSCATPNPNSPPPPMRPGDPPPRFCGGIRMGRGLIEAYGITMERLLTALSNALGRTVIDKTGLTGSYDVHLEYTPDPGMGAAAFGPGGPGGGPNPAPDTDAAAPSIFTALQEQLGLKVDSAKGPVEVLVIDSVEKPSEN